MRTIVDIDAAHSREIVREIGNRLRDAIVREGGSLRDLSEHGGELPTRLRMQLERLRQLDDCHQTTATGLDTKSALQRRKQQSTP